MIERLNYKGTRRLPEIFSTNDINLILKTLIDSPSYFSKSKIPKEWGDWLRWRDICIIASIYILGLRPKEACSLMFDDFNFNYMTVKINGKNNKNRKDRLIPIPKVLFNFYRQYFKFDRNKFWRGSRYLFPSFQNSPLPVTSERFKNVFREKVLKPIGLWNVKRESKAQYRTLYKLRHSRASHMLNKQIKMNGKPDLFAISNFLGHSDIRSTMIYLHTDESYMNHLRKQTDI